MTTVKKQIDQFIAKVTLCAKSFSVQTSADVFQKISELNPEVETIQTLRDFTSATDELSQTRDLLVYAKWYLDNINYLRDLKYNFSSRIYQKLVQQSSIQSTPLSISGSTISLQKSNTPDKVAAQMLELLKQLDNLLENEHTINAELFSPGSRIRLNYRGYSEEFESLIRLVPDVLLKLQELGKLATLWLDLDAQSKTVSKDGEREQERTSLISKLTKLNTQIKYQEQELEKETEDLQELLDREERANAISSENHNLEIKMSKLKDKLQKSESEISDIQDLIKTAGSNETFRNQLDKDLKEKMVQHQDTQEKIRFLEYQQDIVVEDLCVELELRPSLIRLTNSVQDKCMKLEQSLEVSKQERMKLETALRPLSQGQIMRPKVSIDTDMIRSA